MRPVLVAAAALGALALTLSACGDSNDDVKATKLNVSETSTGKGRYAYEGLKSIPAGPVEIKFTNDGDGKASHELQLVRIDGDHSQAEITKIVTQEKGPIPEWLNAAGGVGSLRPGESATTTEVLPPGKYYAFDTESEGGQGEGTPFLKQGAFASFQVTGDAKSAGLPKSTAKVTVKDKGSDEFEFQASGLKAGDNTLEFVNDSKKEIHHVLAFPLLPGKTAADAKKAFASNGPPKGQPPVDFENGAGTSVINQKTKEVTQLKLEKPGNYVLVCFLTDRDGKGKPHVEEGLLKEVKVP